MKKIFIQSGLIVVVLIIITIFSNVAKGSEIITNKDKSFPFRSLEGLKIGERRFIVKLNSGVI